MGLKDEMKMTQWLEFCFSLTFSIVASTGLILSLFSHL